MRFAEVSLNSSANEQVYKSLPTARFGRRTARRSNAREAVWQGLLIPAVVIGLWALLGHFNLLPAGIVPSLGDTIAGWRRWVFGAAGAKMLDAYNGSWLSTVGYSVHRVLLGYAIGLFVAVPMGIIVGRSRLLTRLIDPTIQGLRPVPITAWIPFAIACFGVSDANAIFLVALSAFFPIFVNATQGARDINKHLVRAARMMGISNNQLLLRVVFPSALPAILTGMRLGIGYAWTVLVVAEMVSVKAGVGYVLWDAYYISRMDLVVADMITIGLLGFLSDRAIVAMETRVLTWKRSQSE
jgi:NitT/TauT family transport system permease protein